MIGALKRAMYRQGGPNAFARLINRLDILAYGSRLLPLRRIAVLKVVGRHRPHMGLKPTAPLTAFREVAPRRPTFRIAERTASTDAS